jgi:hypothetical protein
MELVTEKFQASQTTIPLTHRGFGARHAYEISDLTGFSLEQTRVRIGAHIYTLDKYARTFTFTH